jgi:hypothetical protein
MTPIPGQLNDFERRVLSEAITRASKKPERAIEVGTWFGGGSTLHILRALEKNGIGHLWGVEADRSTFDQMLANIRAGAPEVAGRFTPLFGFSHAVLPKWLLEQGQGVTVDFVFLDGGNHPGEQIREFDCLAPYIPVGGQIMSHDARVRKGKWLVPYVSLLDNWESRLYESESELGLFHARKIAPQPSPASLKRARAKLFRMRWSPVEFASAILPSSVCGFVINHLPTSVVKWLYRGARV